jgi:predicted acetyltransferase
MFVTNKFENEIMEPGWLGLSEVLLTCDPGNEPSRRVILANGGVPGGRPRGEDRFWIRLAGSPGC